MLLSEQFEQRDQCGEGDDQRHQSAQEDVGIGNKGCGAVGIDNGISITAE